jgi:AbrB family looped-hinge helix DNA binding protein
MDWIRTNGLFHAMWRGMINGMTVTMDKAGRIVLPAKVREKMRLEPGAVFNLATEGDRVQLDRVRPVSRLIYKNGMPMIEFDPPGADDFDVVEEIHRAREERADYVAGVGGYDRDDL